MLLETRRLYLDLVQNSDTPFFESLFSDRNVRKYYILRSDHSANIKLFTEYLVSVNNRKSGIECIIRLKNRMPVGLIGAELINRRTGDVVWNTAYAILPQYWNNGYATEALVAFTEHIKKYNIPMSVLDISDDNIASIKVAAKAGYKQNHRAILFDQDNPQLGFRCYYEKNLKSARDTYYSMAVQAFHAKDFRTAESYFEKALQEAYEPGTPNTDAICYSNMGMACTSYGNYYKAYQCLKKAQSLGLDNPSIQRELQWLRVNQGIG